MAEELKLLPIGQVLDFEAKVAIIGHGLIGTRLEKDFGKDTIVVDYPNFDITHPYQVKDFVAGHPEIGLFINAAGYTNVDGAQQEPEKAYRINVAGNKNLAGACLDNGKYLVSISSETAFGNWRKGSQIFETEIPPVYLPDNVRGVYGATKAQGEYPILNYFIHGGNGLILRISYPSGRNQGYLTKTLGFPKLLDDCEITPTLTPELANVIACAYRSKITKCVLHPVGTVTSPYEYGNLARKRLRIAEAPAGKFSVAEGKAPRPQFGALSNKGTNIILAKYGQRLRTWEEQVDYLFGNGI